MGIPTFLATNQYPPRIMRLQTAHGVDSAGGGATVLSTLSSVGTSGPDFANIASYNAVKLGKIWGHEIGYPPNGLIVTPWAESCKVTCSFKFQIGIYRYDGNYERVCDVKATIGTYRLFKRAKVIGKGGERLSAVNSSHYCDTLVICNDYWDGVDKQDAAGNNGKASLRFDLRGVPYVALNVVSTIPGTGSGKIGFEGTGW